MQFNLSEITFILYEKNSREKNHLIFTNMFFFNNLKCHLNVAMIIVVPIRAKKNLWSKKPYLSKSRWPLGNQILFIFN